MPLLRPGDHVCSLYESQPQLAAIVAGFLAEGLSRNERCWYVPGSDEMIPIRTALERLGVDVEAEFGRSALNLLDPNDTYTAHGGFDPEETLRVFTRC